MPPQLPLDSPLNCRGQEREQHNPGSKEGEGAWNTLAALIIQEISLALVEAIQTPGVLSSHVEDRWQKHLVILLVRNSHGPMHAVDQAALQLTQIWRGSMLGAVPE